MKMQVENINDANSSDIETIKIGVVSTNNINNSNAKKNKNFKEIINKNSNEGNLKKEKELKIEDDITKQNKNIGVNKNINNYDKSTACTKKSENSIFLGKFENFDSLNLKPKGLYNPSVYCFMNTCLQCLLSIPELNHYFVSGSFKKDKKIKNSLIPKDFDA